MKKYSLIGGDNTEKIKKMEDEIDNVLGDKFIKLVNLLETGGYEAFKLKYSGNMYTDSTTGDQSKLDDLDYDFSEYLISIAEAFKLIETPDISKMEIAGVYEKTIESMYNDMINGKMDPDKPLKMEDFDYKGLLCKNNNFKYISEGFNLLSYHKSICTSYTPNYKKGSSLRNIILYLHHFIAILDTTNLKSYDIVQFLKNDFQFTKLLFTVYREIKDNDYFPNKKFKFGDDTSTIIMDGILRGLIAIADKIIIKFHKGNNINAEGKYYDFVFTLADDSLNVLKTATEGLVNTKADANDLHVAFFALDKIEGGAANINVKDMTPVSIKEYQTNGLMNPMFLNDKEIKKDIAKFGFENEQIQSGGAGGEFDEEEEGGVNGIYKAPQYLYGPKHVTDDKYYLITQGKQGDQNANAEFLKEAVVDQMWKHDSTGFINIVNTKMTLGNAQVCIFYLTLYILFVYKHANAKAENFYKALYATAAGKQTMRDEATKNYNGFLNICNRLRLLPASKKELTKEFLEYSDVFSNSFALSTYKYLKKENGELKKLMPALVIAPKTKTLVVPFIKRFYINIICKNIKFYDIFFNLVDNQDKTRRVALEEACAKTDTELANYRLNVKKNIKESLIGVQFGAGEYGDIIFLKYLRDFPLNKKDITGLWLSNKIRVDAEKMVSTKGVEAIRYIFRNVYSNKNEITVTLYDKDLELDVVYKHFVDTQPFITNRDNYYKNLLRDAINGKTKLAEPRWSEMEHLISEHVLRDASTWDREDGVYVKRNSAGKIIRENPGDSCTFIKNNLRECIETLTDCFINEDIFSDKCKRFLDFDFEITPGPMALKDLVNKINPMLAFKILQKFKFGAYVAHEEIDDSIENFTRYKVQSLGSWIEELLSGTNRCEQNTRIQFGGGLGCDSRPLREQLGNDVANKIISMLKDKNKFLFFQYLDILVQWVNANFQAMNEEEVKDPNYEKNNKYPDPDKTFTTYNYVNPHDQIKWKMRGFCDGLNRLKNSILGGVAGINGPALISNVTNIPSNMIAMPLARQGFVHPYMWPQGMPMPMMGGGINSTEYNLRNMKSLFGYQMFRQIYDELTRTMESMNTNKVPTRLNSKTRQAVMSKLENFKLLEEELAKQMINLVERNKLYNASHGHINAYGITDNQLPIVLQKHANLLDYSNAYNKKAVSLIDIMSRISDLIIDKLDKLGKPSSQYYRPLSSEI